MRNDNTYNLLAKTLYGLENVLADELKSIGADQIKIANRAVYFSGDKEMIYKANYYLRTAICILIPIRTFKINDENDLYKKVQEIDWSLYMNLKMTFAVESTVYSSKFKHTQYPALKVKDSIADQFRQKTNRRPNVDTTNPDILINIHIAEDTCTISLNSSGEPLFKRGYRVATQEAPLNEILAAGLIYLSGWKPEQNLIDPMCGSGTILIEAALIRNNIPPGTYRRHFGFKNWLDFDNEIFNNIVHPKELLNTKHAKVHIIGNDISKNAINSAKENIKYAQLQHMIELHVGDFQNFNPNIENGVVITNPPYGERLKQEDIVELYKSFGNTLKKSYLNFEAWILSANLNAMKFIGLHPSKKIKLMNAALECTFNKYEIYEGTKKMNKNNLN
jgi:putative N6-adenine-specific DNA methylase